MFVVPEPQVESFVFQKLFSTSQSTFAPAVLVKDTVIVAASANTGILMSLPLL